MSMRSPTPAKQPTAWPDLPPAELEFYSAYEWCLDPHLTIRTATDHLRSEIDRLKIVPHGWQTREVATNIFLLSCALLNGLDEYLCGPTLRMPKQLATTPLGRAARSMTDSVTSVLWCRCRAQAYRWRDSWQSALDDFLAVFVRGPSDPACFTATGARLAQLLQSPLPSDLQATHLSVPSAFHRLDLTHVDILALGERFVKSFPDRSQPVLLLGLRTAGTYFAALLRAFLKSEGYQTVSSLTVRPKRGPGRSERNALRWHASRRYALLIMDDPPHTGDTLLLAFDIAYRAGFDPGQVRALVPTHSARRNWAKSLPGDRIITLEPEQWHQHRLLAPQVVERQLAEYLVRSHVIGMSLVQSRRADEFNACMDSLARGKRDARLKRIYEVRLQTAQARTEIRYVLAKAVGLGWLGYHAFLAGHRLSAFVPPILGLRDGILYMEWIPQSTSRKKACSERALRIDASASYVAARARSLALRGGRTLGQSRHENGLRVLGEVLSKAYGRFATDILMWSHVRQRLCQQSCPCPTLVDANMSRGEWINGRRGLLKTDYEHHGMGKTELNVIDPAYDLAETILDLALSQDEERRLIRRYIGESGDLDTEQRLFMNKMLAGLWAMTSAQERLFDGPQPVDRQQALHRQFMRGWGFLTAHTARFCGSFCRSTQDPRWHSPLVALDIDGVIDRRLFGFPCTTAAGMEALALLNTHGFSVAVNTARSVAEVKDYCAAYGFAGGVAEGGSYLWDAVDRRGRALVDPDAMRQLDELRRCLEQLPGVFLDDRHQYSIRAFMYAKDSSSLLRLLKSTRSFNLRGSGPIPLPILVVSQLIATLRLNRLSVHQTTIDTSIVANDIDKGSGLLALRDWILGPDAETIAVGDSDADLPMFRVATRSFAPAQIKCRRQARLLHCQIAPHRFQRGLLDIARTLVGPAARGGRPWAGAAMVESCGERLFLELLQAADQMPFKSVIGALLDSGTLTTFIR